MGGITDAVGGIFGGGGGPEVPTFSPSDSLQPFQAGGLTGKWVDGSFNVTPDKQRQDLLDSIRKNFGSQADLLRNELFPQASNVFSGRMGSLDDLIAQVNPGFGQLTDARNNIFQSALERLQGARQSAVGDLKSNLERRNVLGSSFGQDAIIRAGAEYDALDRELSGQQAEANATSFLQELELTNNLLNQQYQTNIDNLNTTQSLLQNALKLEGSADTLMLDDMNKIAEIGANLISGASSNYTDLLLQQQEMAAKSAAAYGSGMGDLFSTGVSLFGGGGGGSGEIFGMDAATVGQIASTAATLFLSDRRLKHSIIPADIKNGFRRYIFSYSGSAERYLGVMAQEVKKLMPDAVKKINGYLAVDYDKLGFNMERVSW